MIEIGKHSVRFARSSVGSGAFIMFGPSYVFAVEVARAK
jgi:hypothetical protein